MRLSIRILTTSLFLGLFCLSANGQTTIFSETFNEANGSTSGSSAEGIPWTSACPWCIDSDDWNEVNNGAMEGKDTNGPATFETTSTIDISDCNSITLTFDYSFSQAWEGSGNMETNDECGVCAGDPTMPLATGCAGLIGSGNGCWDFLWANLIIDGAIVDEELIGETGTTNAEQSGSISLVACVGENTTAEILLTYQTWADAERVSFDNIVMLCYEGGNAEATDLVVCEGDDIDLMETLGNPGTDMWSWSGPAGTANTQNWTISPASSSDGGTYTVTVTDINNCTATDDVMVTVNSSPMAMLTGGGTLCTGQCMDVDLNISGGTPLYDIDLVFSTNFPLPISFPFTMPSVPVNGVLTLCLDEPGTVPVYDAANNTLHIPELGGTLGISGTITLNGITDANGCTDNTMSSVNITLAESPNAFPASLEACDIGGGIGTFDLNDPTIINTINGGSGDPVTFYLDMALTIPVTPPLNTGTTTIYAATSNGTCDSEAVAIMLTVVTPVFAGNDGTLNVCEDGSVDLFTGLTGGPDIGGTWVDISGSGATVVPPSTANFLGVAPGDYTFQYTVTGTAPCPDDMAEVVVTVDPMSNAGINGMIDICEGETMLQDLFGALNGVPQTGGMWSDDSGAGVSLGNPNAVDFSGIGAGMYIFEYTITGAGACPDDMALVTVNIELAPNAGTNGTIDICEGETALQDLFTALGGSPQTGGNWTETTSSGVNLSNPNMVDFSGANPGNYVFNYTIPATAGCPQDIATVTVNIGMGPDAGMDGMITICEGETTVQDLVNALGGSPQTGGMWNDDDASGVNLSNPFVVDFSAVANGSYDFTYSVSAVGCADATAIVTVQIDDAPDAGLDGNIDVCLGETGLQDFFGGIGGTPDLGGTWNDDNGAGVNLTNPNAVDVSSVPAGNYNFTYTVTGVGVCPPDNSMVTLTVINPPDAGANGGIIICDGETALQDLFTALTGTPQTGGTWNDDDATGVNISNPNAVDFSGLGVGNYDFTYEVNSSDVVCSDAMATVTVTITNAPSAGLDNNIDICEGETTLQDLQSGLGGTPDAGGNWSDDDASGVNLTNPNAVDFSGLASGMYDFTYTIPASGSCPQVDATVTVNIDAAPDAGADGGIIICDGETALQDLEAGLTGTPDAGGMWNDDDASGVNLSNPNSVDFSGLGVGMYDFTYTVIGMGVCTNVSAIVTVTVTTAPTAGLDDNVDLCEGETALQDLFGSLGGTPDAGGTWTDDDASGVNLTNPNAVDFSGLASGMYEFTYTIAASGSCPMVDATVTVNIDAAPDAGADGGIIICDGETALQDLEAGLTGTPDVGGMWNDDDASGVNLSNPNAVDFSGLGVGMYDFTYTVTGMGVCSNASAMVTVTITTAPSAGFDGGIAFCEGDMSLVDLPQGLGGTPDAGGTWSDDDATGVNLVNPNAVDFSGVAFGIYDFTYSIAASGSCPQVDATVTVTIEGAPDAGADGGIIICDGETALQDLDAGLTGTPDAGGMWNDDDASGVNLSNPSAVDFSGLGVGMYDFTYTVTGVGVCSDVSAVVTVTITTAPSAGVDNDLDLCQGETALQDLPSNLGGVPDSGGTWSDDDASGVNLSNPNAVDFSGLAAGMYDFTYTIPASGSCPQADATLTVIIEVSPNAGMNGDLTICEGETTTQDLFGELTGTPQTGGMWSDDDATGVNLTNPNAVDFSGIAPGIYNFTYSVGGSGVCLATSATVSVEIEMAPNAGLDGMDVICEGDGNQNIFALLNGTPDLGGTWNDDSGSGVDLTNPNAVDFTAVSPGMYDFTYTVSGTGVCTNASAIVSIEVETAPFAGFDGGLNICAGETLSQDLFAALGGAPDMGGTWADTDGSGVDLNNPNAVDVSSLAVANYTFTYTVAAAGTCPSDDAVVTIAITSSPDAGLDAMLPLCEEETILQDLFAALGGTPQAGGTWTDDDASGVSLANPFGVDFSTVLPGAYDFTYTIPASGSCPQVDATITVDISDFSDPGQDGSIDLCEGDATLVDLFAELDGTPETGGTWTDDSGSGVNISNPNAVDFSGQGVGIYLFSYVHSANGNCPEVSSIVAVTIVLSPNAGEDGNLDICEGETNLQDLFSALGGSPQTTGNWMDDDATGIDLTDPAMVDLSNLSEGSYQFSYTVGASGFCSADVATVTVNVEGIPDVGSPGSVVNICQGTTQIANFHDLLMGDEDLGGVWSDDLGAGVDLSDPMNVDLSMIPNGVYDFTYSITGVACLTSSNSMTMVVGNGPDAGTDAATVVCNQGGIGIDLTVLLSNPDLGGTWLDESGCGLDLTDPTNVVFDGINAPSCLISYTIPASNFCDELSSTLIVSINQQLSAGEPNTTVVCEGTDIDLNNVLLNADLGGEFVDTDMTGLLNGSILTTTGLSGMYSFEYMHAANNPCVASSTTLTVDISTSVTAGNNVNLEVCSGEIINLFDILDGADGGGIFTENNPSGMLENGNFLNTTGQGGNGANIVYTVGDGVTCPEDQIDIQVEVFNSPSWQGQIDNSSLCAEECAEINIQTEWALNAQADILLSNDQGFNESLTINLDDLDHIIQICNTGTQVNLAPNSIELDGTNANWTIELSNYGNDMCSIDSILQFEFSSLMSSTNLVDDQLCADGQVIVNNVTYDMDNPMGEETVLAANGCDSVITVALDFFPEALGNENGTLCFGQTLTVGTEIFDENNPSGTVMLPSAASTGCDSTVTVDLDFQEFAGFEYAETICDDEFVQFNFVIYDFNNPSGIDTIENGSVAGCDSILNINLSFFTVEEGLFEQTLCTGQSITVGNIVFDENNPGGLVDLPNASVQGCDSTVMVILEFDSFVSEDVDPTLCPDESVMVNGNVYDIDTPTGQETIVMGSSGGCDSIVTIDLSFYIEPEFLLIDDLCSGQSVVVGPDTYDEITPSGTTVLDNASANGCDSIVNVMLNFTSSVDGDLNPTLCMDESVTVNNVTYDFSNPSGQETLINGSVAGCDSVVNIDLNFYPAALGSYSDLLCEDESFMIGSQEFDFSNTPVNVTLGDASVNGCDSIVNLDVNWLFHSEYDYVETICEGSSIEIGGQLFDSNTPDGVVVIPNAAGCDSTIYVDLSFDTPDITSAFTANGTQGVYQLDVMVDFTPTDIIWEPADGLSCTDCLDPIATITQATSYLVTVVQGDGCEVQSLITLPFEIELDDYYVSNVFSPNKDGANDVFFVQTDDLTTLVAEMLIFDRWGELIWQTQNVPINDPAFGWDGTFKNEDLNPGVYVYLITLLHDDLTTTELSGDVTIVR